MEEGHCYIIFFIQVMLVPSTASDTISDIRALFGYFVGCIQNPTPQPCRHKKINPSSATDTAVDPVEWHSNVSYRPLAA